MSYYLCNVCGNVFDGKYIKVNKYSYETECPISDCCGSIFEVDEEMIIPIKVLNDKGYATQFCCSGHLYGTPGEGYIQFYNDYIPTTAPKGWIIDGNSIRYRFSKNATAIKKLKERHSKIEALVKWCDELKSLE